MRGGASLKGKGGRVGFRKNLFKGKEGRGDFRKPPSLRVKRDGVIFEKPPSLMLKRDGVIAEYPSSFQFDCLCFTRDTCYHGDSIVTNLYLLIFGINNHFSS